jgi:hypothetical protein
MRTERQLAFYRSILETLPEAGCPFCRFLKDYQSARLQNHSDRKIRSLCNFHAWGVAAVQNALTAVQVFADLLETAVREADEKSGCDICNEISTEEDHRMREFVSCLERTDVAVWLRKDAVLCIPHAIKLRRRVKPVIAARVDTILDKCRRQLLEELKALRLMPQAKRPGWGSLGRAAEFLVSQRGLQNSKELQC